MVTTCTLFVLSTQFLTGFLTILCLFLKFRIQSFLQFVRAGLIPDPHSIENPTVSLANELTKTYNADRVSTYARIGGGWWLFYNVPDDNELTPDDIFSNGRPTWQILTREVAQGVAEEKEAIRLVWENYVNVPQPVPDASDDNYEDSQVDEEDEEDEEEDNTNVE